MKTETIRMISGGIAAPAARTIAKKTMVIPNKMKDQDATVLIWMAISMAAPSPVRNRPLRSHFPAPTFWAAMDETAAPTANASICT